MQKRQYYNKCKNLFEKASQMGVELEFDPEQFDANRLNCTWIGGWYAYITLTPELDIEIGAIGDVCATLLDKNGEEIICVKDKNNTGAFAECMGEYIKNDDHLKKLKQENRLIFENNNWIEIGLNMMEYIIPTVVKIPVSWLILASSMTIFSMTISWRRLIKCSKVYQK